MLQTQNAPLTTNYTSVQSAERAEYFAQLIAFRFRPTSVYSHGHYNDTMRLTDLILCATTPYHEPTTSCVGLRCKNIRISTDILWRVYSILTESVPYRLRLYPHCNVGPGFIIPLICGYKRIQNRFRYNDGKLATKYPQIYGYYLQCRAYGTQYVA